MRKFLLLAPIVMVLFACQKNAEPDPVEVTFQAGLSQYITKASDTAFEAGDSLALWAEGGVTASGMALVCNGSSFATPSPLYWTVEGTAAASFSAMYPFSASKAGSVFTVKADQSTHAAYTASDLMLGSAKADHGTKSVNLPMKHQLCQIAVCIKNELEDPVSEVLLQGVKRSVAFSKTGIGAASGNADTVKTAAATIEGGSAYVAILPPQEFDFTVEVVTAGGARFKYLTGPFRVDEGGVQMRFSLVLNSTSIACSVEPYATGWSLPLVQDSSSVESLSVGAFKALPTENNVLYKVSGKIVGVSGSSFSLTDAVDTLAVGSLLSSSGVPDVQFAASGLNEGDFLRVYGKSGTAVVYLNHAPGIAVAPASGENLVWTGVGDLADWESEVSVPASAFAGIVSGTKLNVHLSAVFGNFWSLSLYSGTMEPVLTYVSGTASSPVVEVSVNEEIATLLKSSGLVIRGTAVVGAVGF